MKSLPIDEYVLDVLMRDLVGHERSPSAFVVYLYVWRRTVALDRASVRVSQQMVASSTGLSKSAVQSAVRRLVRRGLLRAKRDAPTAIPEYTPLRPWRR